MDPPAMINGDAVFRNTVNATPFNHADIWQLPVNGGESGDGLGLRRPHFAQLLRRFPTMDAANLEASGDEMSAELEQRGNNSAAGGVGVGGSRKRRDVEEESARGVSTSNGVPNGSDGKRPKTSGCKDHDGADKAEAEPSSARPKEQSKPTPEPPKQDYIHVRARRGQATDSHSLAERARREKISERMKILQDLVPGCNKVIGKALVLDEIINYIQSLQRQVEFLSMKLEAVTTGLNPGIEVFPSKDFGQQSSYDTGVMPFGSQAPREYIRGSSPEWLHMQVGGGFERTT